MLWIQCTNTTIGLFVTAAHKIIITMMNYFVTFVRKNGRKNCKKTERQKFNENKGYEVYKRTEDRSMWMVRNAT